jgi:catalase
VDADYVQPGNLFRLMSAGQQAELLDNIVGSLSKAPEKMQKKMVAHFTKADPAYGEGVAKRLSF